MSIAKILSDQIEESKKKTLESMKEISEIKIERLWDRLENSKIIEKIDNQTKIEGLKLNLKDIHDQLQKINIGQGGNFSSIETQLKSIEAEINTIAKYIPSINPSNT